MSTDAPKQESPNFIQLFSKGDSNEIDEKSVIVNFNEYFHNNVAPPEDYDPSLIDVFIRVLGDPDQESYLRACTSFIVVKLSVCQVESIVHSLIEKGAVNVLVNCIGDTDETVRTNCLGSMTFLARHCFACKSAVYLTGVLESIANLMHSRVIHSLDCCNNAIACVINILTEARAHLQPQTARLLVSEIVKTMLRLGGQGDILQNSFDALEVLSRHANFEKYDQFKAQIDFILKENSLITSAFDAIASGSPTLTISALKLIGNILCGTDEQADRIVMRDGFMKTIGDCLDSSSGGVRLEAARVIYGVTQGYRSHIDLMLKEPEIVTLLITMLNHDDVELQKVVCRVFARMFSAFSSRPALTVEGFVRNGVRTIDDFATKSGFDAQVLTMIREVLPKINEHPEFYSSVDEIVWADGNPNTLFFNLWSMKASLVENITGSLKSYTNWPFFCRPSQTPPTVPRGATTVDQH